MNLLQLEEDVRVSADDYRGAELWRSQDIRKYLNEGEKEACIRARLLNEIFNTAITNITLVVGQRVYRAHRSLFETEALRIIGQTQQIERVPYEDLRYAQTPNGTPRYYSLNGPIGESRGMNIVLNRAPDTVGVLEVHGFRTPLYEMTADSDEPEIDYMHHDGLVNWALYRMYRHRDIDAESIKRSDDNLALFENRFGIRRDANVMRKQLRHRARVTQAVQF